jgi:ribulose-5-phosphate 4-epimerase/fuculose-1-phosphate aldolase
MSEESLSLRGDLVAASRILAHEEILDAYGHVSARLPGAADRFLLARARSAALVEDSDLVEHGLDGEPVLVEDRPLFLERYLHAAIYAARADVGAIAHAHTPSILPFSVSERPLRAVIHTARFLGTSVPVWDLQRSFPGEWSPLVRNLTYGASLAERLGSQAVALLRGHGCVVVGRDPKEVVARAIDMDRNAKVQLVAERLGEYVALHEGECEDLSTPKPPLASDERAWEYFCRRAGVQ